ncbi:MAG: VanZ family protein [Spongiibacteraceae bacterium]
MSRVVGFRGLFIVTFVAVTVLALMPSDQVVVTTGWDKTNHSLAFFTLLFLLDHGFPTVNLWQRKCLLLVAYGFSIEVLQAMLPGREPSLLDVFADCVGLLAYILVRPLAIQLPFINRSTLR